MENYNQLCKQICDSNDRIVGAWVFDVNGLSSSHVRPRFAEPDKKEQETMFIQAQIMLSIVSSNERMYGRLKYVMVSFEYFDAFLFPLVWEDGEQNSEKTIVSIGCIKPYSIEMVVSAVEKMLVPARRA